MDITLPDHPHQLSAQQWIERARETLRELDRANEHDLLGDAIDDLNNALAVLTDRQSRHMEGVLMVGNVVSGYRFVGPFNCESLAAAWATEHAHRVGHDWTTATMRNPNEVA